MRRIFPPVLLACLVAAAPSAGAPYNAPPAAHVFHAGWSVDGPIYIEKFLDYPRPSGSAYLARNSVMPGDGVEIDIFTADEKTTRQGILIRNESDVEADVTLSGCGFIHMEGKLSDHSYGFRTIVAVDAPQSVITHLVLPARDYTALNLSNSSGLGRDYYPGMPKFSRQHPAGFQCDKIEISHPPP